MITVLSAMKASPEGFSRLLGCLTAARLLLVPVLIVTFLKNPPAMTLCLVLFMAADLFDGVLARRVGVDGPARRAMDSIVDRIAIDSCLIAACLVGALPPILLIGFLARDVYCARVCARVLRARGIAIKADIVYRGLSFSFAVWAISAPFLSAPGRTAFATAIFVASIAVAVDLARSARIVLTRHPDVSHAVISAGLLRKQAWGGGADALSPRNQVPAVASVSTTPV